MEPSVWLRLDRILVNGHVFEKFVLFTFTTGVGGGKKREFCSIFIVNILVKDVMNAFTDGRHDTHSQIFRLELEKWKNMKSYKKV